MALAAREGPASVSRSTSDPFEVEPAVALFSERPAIVYEVGFDRLPRLSQAAREHGLVAWPIGTVTPQPIVRALLPGANRCAGPSRNSARPPGPACGGAERGGRMSAARVAVVQFPGVNCEAETVRALETRGVARGGVPLDEGRGRTGRLRRLRPAAASPTRTGARGVLAAKTRWSACLPSGPPPAGPCSASLLFLVW